MKVVDDLVRSQCENTYDESDYQEETLEAEKAFQVKYFSYFVGEVKYFFFCFVDMAITSLKGRFKELMVIKDIYSDFY